MEASHEMAGHLASHVQEQARIYIVVILIFGYHFLFEHELSCTCEHLHRDCVANMFLPLLVILLALLWTDKHFQRACCHKRKCSTVVRVLQALFVSFFWPASALLDADWTACCFNLPHCNISCIDEDDLSDEDFKILNGLRDDSRFYGLLILMVMFLIAITVSLIQKKTSSTKYDWEEIVLEEGDKFVPEKMRVVARLVMLDKLKKHIQRRNWEECFCVGEEVLKDPPSADTLTRISSDLTLAGAKSRTATDTTAAQDKVTHADSVESPSSSGKQPHSDTTPLLPKY